MNTIPAHMKGVLMTGYGGFERLEIRDDIVVPSPAQGEVLVQVSAAAVNNTDINTRLGWYAKDDDNDDKASWSGSSLQFPRIQGADVCGHIVAVGQDVAQSRIGERVLIEPCIVTVDQSGSQSIRYFGSEMDGGFADYTVIPSAQAHKIESDMTAIELASFPCSYSTAENMLTRARLTSGETVLITGASGGVGSAAVQLAKAKGAEVIAVTSPAKFETLRTAGADHVLDRNDAMLDILGTNKVDVVIDLVAGEKWPDLLEVLKPKGRYAVAGAIGGAFVTLDVRTLYLKDLSFFGCTILEPEVFPNLIKLIEQKKIKPLVSATFPLEEIVKAQEEFLRKNHTGKIVLTL
ncbi:alcohol dehydrogenase family protein [Cohaesibacter celericrescens]|uniref:alcohol dehydrogenase family protein n=1 Tax=Cohaesibacter celericrescens TaxID=2067669 RepID=UPI003566FEAA